MGIGNCFPIVRCELRNRDKSVPRQSLRFEVLETRLMPTAPMPTAVPCTPHSQTGLRFNFSLDDPDGAFDAFPELASALEAAGAIASDAIFGLGTIDVRVRPNNDIPRATGGTAQVSFVREENGLFVWENSTIREALTGIDPNGSEPDLLIDFNTEAYLPNLWFDPSGRARTAPVPNDKTDFLSVALHEILHGMGFQGYRRADGSFADSVRATYDVLTQYGAGRDQEVVYFVGPAAMSTHGGPVPLTNANYSHVANADGTDGDDLIGDLMNGVVFFFGTKYSIGNLDLAILEDLGLETRRADADGVSISGYAFADNNGDGERSDDEPGLARSQIHFDTDSNGTIDASAITDNNGCYRFDRVPPGTHRLTQALRVGYVETLPSSGGRHELEVATENITNLDFGSRDTPPTIVDISLRITERGRSKRATPPREFLLSTSEPLDRRQVSSLNNYVVFELGSDRLAQSADDKPVRLKSAVYDRTLGAVRLVARQRLAFGDLYQVIVRDDVGWRDSSGNRLDGDNDGQSGGAFVATVAAGRSLFYFDQANNQVTIDLTGDGIMRLRVTNDQSAHSLVVSSALPTSTSVTGNVVALDPDNENPSTVVVRFVIPAGVVHNLVDPRFIVISLELT